jgi:predicted nucleic acid-binding Zn ribbon protein
MRRNNTQTIAQVLREYIDTLSIRRKLKESRLEKQWEELLGKNAASLTRKLYIKDGILYVFLNSSVLRNELLMMRETLIRRINEKAGEELVKKIVLR